MDPHIDEFKFGVRRYGQTYTDHAFIQKHAVGSPPLFQGGDIGVRAVGSVIRPKDGVESGCFIEELLEISRRNAPGGIRLMAIDTRAAIRSDRRKNRLFRSMVRCVLTVVAKPVSFRVIYG